MYIYIQQDEVLAELREYVHNNSQASDAPAVTHTIAYLEALNKIFEKSLLGVKVRVFYANGPTMQRIDKGYLFFVGWAKEIESGEDDEDKSSFLAWQVHILHVHVKTIVIKRIFFSITDLGSATDHSIWFQRAD